MKNLTVLVKKGEAPQTFPIFRSTSLIGLIETINTTSLSLEEVEAGAIVAPGTILAALQTDDLIAPMDMFRLGNFLCD